MGLLKHALHVDYVMLGGGQAKKLRRAPPGARLGDNLLAIEGGLRLWNESRPATMVKMRGARPKLVRAVGSVRT